MPISQVIIWFCLLCHAFFLSYNIKLKIAQIFDFKGRHPKYKIKNYFVGLLFYKWYAHFYYKKHLEISRINFIATKKTIIFSFIKINQIKVYKGYRCESVISIWAWRVTWNELKVSLSERIKNIPLVLQVGSWSDFN